MKYPKEMILTVQNNKEFIIKFLKVDYLPTKDVFQCVIQITNDFIENHGELVEFITEEREF